MPLSEELVQFQRVAFEIGKIDNIDSHLLRRLEDDERRDAHFGSFFPARDAHPAPSAHLFPRRVNLDGEGVDAAF
jgi:hypothetical protein